MNHNITPKVSLKLFAALAVAGALLLPVAASATPTDASAPHRMADKGGVLPVKHTIEKNAAAKPTEGPYVVTLTNTSAHVLKLTVKIDMSVAVHNRPKDKDLTQELAPGKEWKIDDLAAEDKLTVKAEGFEPLKLTVH